MTAVATPPSVQSGPRLGWYAADNGGQSVLSSMNTDEVSRMFMPRKSVQRSNSSSSISSTISTATVSNVSQSSNVGFSVGSESSNWSTKKKPTRGLWPSAKAEPVSGITNAHPQPVAASPLVSGSGAISAMSAIHQPSPIVPSQQLLQSSQQNGTRSGPMQSSSDPPAILTLLPLNGTFERKQITVPYFPEVLRIGRQTNAKTVPTPTNGFFDSKVLSRQHAEIWADRSGKIWIRDVKSSNGTFVNGQRLSPEGRDSEPHELRENDALELGIDIVSEDQKSIVHHKVSAKVEHAGIYGTSPNILDLNFGDIDPTSGGGLLPSPLSQPLSHLRGRTNSSLSNRNAQSVSGNQLSTVLHQQRQMNYWLSPITIEQVVKRLSSEMRQAKQQSQDLRQTDDFLHTLISQESPEKDKSNVKPAHTESNGLKHVNGRPKIPRIDQISRFSDPPAPPPQQPLPEKPDAPRRLTHDSLPSPLKHSDTEKASKSTTGNSPASREPSQILSLIEALSTAKKELDSQSARVKELEDLLLQERLARESAEEKARQLESQSLADRQHSEVDPVLDPRSDEKDIDQPLEPQITKKDEDLPEIENIVKKPEHSDESRLHEIQNGQLQQRLDNMVAEMESMRRQIEAFKARADTAQVETTEARKSLAEMIETLRHEREAAGSIGLKSEDGQGHPKNSDNCTQLATESTSISEHDLDDRSQSHRLSLTEFESAATALATHHRRLALIEHSTPYASILGVVLLGVGLMAYLNGWQKVDK